VKKKMADKAEALRKEEAKLAKWEAEVETLRNKIISISDKISDQAGDEKFRQELKEQQEKLERQQLELKVQIAESKVKIAELKEKDAEEIKRLEDDVASLKAQQLAHMTDSLRNMPLSAEEAFQKVIEVIKLPLDIEAFEPKLWRLPDDHPLKDSVETAKVYASFKNPANPEILLTEAMNRPIDYSNFCSFRLSDGGYQLLSTEVSQTDIDLAGAILLIGTSGSGKTMFAYHKAILRYATFLLCSRKGNGGSSDLETIIQQAKADHANNKSMHEIKSYVKSRVKKSIWIRSRLLTLLTEKYADFKPRHWLIAQLYSEQIFGHDVFARFQTMNVIDPEIMTGSTSLIILDEAQVADALLVGFFPSESTETPGVYRSLLAPIVSAIALHSDTPMMILGTGLSGSSVYETMISPIKRGVRPILLGANAFFDLAMIKEKLKVWGVPINDTFDTPLAKFEGRPRHAANLAESSLVAKGMTTKVMKDVASDLEKTYLEVVNKFRQRDRRNPTETIRIERDMYFHLRTCAAAYLLGRIITVAEGSALEALRLGLCALRRDVTNKDEGDDQVKRAKVDDVSFVIQEPLLIAVLVKDAAQSIEEALVTQTDHSTIGDLFEDILAFRATEFGSCVTKVAQSLLPSTAVSLFYREWSFVGFQDEFDFQFARQCREFSEVHSYLQQALSLKQSVVLFPCVLMGPDLIIVLWSDVGTSAARAQPLVIFVQAKSGDDGSTPSAFQSLEQLYTQNRSSTAVADDPRASAIWNTLENFSTLVALVVIKPLSGGGIDPCVVNGQLRICVDQFKMNTLMPTLSGLAETIRNSKGWNAARTVRKTRWDELVAAFPNDDISPFVRNVSQYLTGNNPKRDLSWAKSLIIKRIRQ